jgi:glyoxylase-like metal-dependent hydrolase (beta-lactamase superfamily II)
MKFAGHKLATLTLCVILLSLSGLGAANPPSRFDSVTPHVRVYHDVVNVGLIERNGKALLIDSGKASILDLAKKAGITRIDWVLYTHHHRDECSGAELLKKKPA